MLTDMEIVVDPVVPSKYYSWQKLFWKVQAFQGNIKHVHNMVCINYSSNFLLFHNIFEKDHIF